MNDYQKEQWDALTLIKTQWVLINSDEKNCLKTEIQPYLHFRQQIEVFLDAYFNPFCKRNCYENHLSACCSKDGIVTFWADMVINACFSSQEQLDRLIEAVTAPMHPRKCIYLGPLGCRWRLKPLMCAMFLCEAAQKEVFVKNPKIQDQWEALNGLAKAFRWPDQPVLFDRMETFFLARGCRSPLMYINTTPGLLRIKQRACAGR